MQARRKAVTTPGGAPKAAADVASRNRRWWIIDGVERRRLRISGVVQGVGFRPFVYGLARRHGLGGFVLNDGRGVVIEAEGEPTALEGFTAALRAEAPPLARV